LEDGIEPPWKPGIVLPCNLLFLCDNAWLAPSSPVSNMPLSAFSLSFVFFLFLRDLFLFRSFSPRALFFRDTNMALKRQLFGHIWSGKHTRCGKTPARIQRACTASLFRSFAEAQLRQPIFPSVSASNVRFCFNSRNQVVVSFKDRARKVGRDRPARNSKRLATSRHSRRILRWLRGSVPGLVVALQSYQRAAATPPASWRLTSGCRGSKGRRRTGSLWQTRRAQGRTVPPSHGARTWGCGDALPPRLRLRVAAQELRT